MSNVWNFGQWPSWFSSRISRPMGLWFSLTFDHRAGIFKKKNAAPSTSCDQLFSNFSWTFVFNMLTELLFHILKFCIFHFFFFFLKLWNFALGNYKMRDILKTAGCRVKRMNMWGSWSWELLYVGYFSGLVIWVQFGAFGTLCKISDVKTFKRILLLQFWSNFNQTLWKAWWSGGNTVYYLFGTLKFLLTQTTWDWRFQSASPLTVFIQCQPNFTRILATMVDTGCYFSWQSAKF